MSRTVDDGADRAAAAAPFTAVSSEAVSSEAASSEPRANVLLLTARRHVDYGRVRSAMCPAI